MPDRSDIVGVMDGKKQINQVKYKGKRFGKENIRKKKEKE